MCNHTHNETWRYTDMWTGNNGWEIVRTTIHLTIIFASESVGRLSDVGSNTAWCEVGVALAGATVRSAHRLTQVYRPSFLD